MKLVCDLTEPEFAEVERGAVPAFDALLKTIEFRQDGGLLTIERPIQFFDRVRVNSQGRLYDADGPIIRVYFGAKEEE